MPTKPKTEQLSKTISNIMDKKLDTLEKKHYKRWLKVAELSILINEMLQTLTSKLNEYLPRREVLDGQIENDINQIKGEIRSLKNLSDVLKNICSTTVSSINVPHPPPPPPLPTKASKSPKNSSLKNKNVTSSKQFMHDPQEIKTKANAMNKSRNKKLEQKVNSVQKLME